MSLKEQSLHLIHNIEESDYVHLHPWFGLWQELHNDRRAEWTVFPVMVRNESKYIMLLWLNILKEVIQGIKDLFSFIKQVTVHHSNEVIAGHITFIVRKQSASWLACPSHLEMILTTIMYGFSKPVHVIKVIFQICSKAHHN